MIPTFLTTTVGLSATARFLQGLVVAETMTPASAPSSTTTLPRPEPVTVQRSLPSIDDIFAMYLYKPELNRRALETVKIAQR